MNRPQKRGANGLFALALLVVPLLMLGATFAAVPLYRIVSETTGFDGTPRQATAAADHVVDRTMVVRFDGNVAGLPWVFRPEVPEITLKLGETGSVSFMAENTGGAETVGTATFNVTPGIAGAYFNQLRGFTVQALKPGQRIEMPVRFFVSPELAKDHEFDGTRTITLSYTFFPAAEDSRSGKEPVASATDDVAREKL
jgi:cytochrome c oxidase assembly protein subunit 11